MRMNRRDFLKGMLAVAGMTVLPAEIARWEGFDPSPVQIGEIIHPEAFGRLGRVRLNEKWFSLEDASINLIRKYEPEIFAPHPEKYGQYIVVDKKKNLVDSEYEIDFFVRENTVEFMNEPSEIDFLVDTRYMKFSGKGLVSTVEATTFPSRERGENILFGVSLEGVNSVTKTFRAA